jgi:hypothetical protein
LFLSLHSFCYILPAPVDHDLHSFCYILPALVESVSFIYLFIL